MKYQFFFIKVTFVLFFVQPFLLLVAQPAPPVADGKLTGKIVEASQDRPMEFATVSVYTSDSALVTGTITQHDGSFSIDLKNGDYYAIIQFIGLTEHVVDGISISARNRVFDIGTIKMQPQSTELDEVSVVGEKSEMVLSLDKRIFNVGKDLSNTGKSALDILDNVPSVTVDLDGSISLRGSQSIQVLVDGKPSGLVNSGNTDALRSLQGSMIERIEIITNPSARYEAEGMAGIINIVLKKDQQEGVHGTFETTTGYPHQYSLGANVNFRRDKINYFLNYSIRYNERPGSGYSRQELSRPDTSYITVRENNNLRTGLSNRLRGGADFFLNPKNTLTTSFLISYDNQLNEANLAYLDKTIAEQALYETYRIDIEEETELNLEFALNYDKQFDRADHKLVAIAQYVEDSELETSEIGERVIDIPGETNTYDPFIETVYNKESEKNLLLQLDYVYPFGNEGKYEAGYRSEFREILNPYYVDKKDSLGNWERLPGESNNVEYVENIYAVYTQAGEKFGRFSLLLGLRGELSEVKTYLHETGGQNERMYFDLFPTAHSTFELNKNHSLQLSYSRRINRPHFWLLNPFYSYTDPRNRFGGNPNLEPEYTHSGEAGYMFKTEGYDLYSGLYYRYTTNAIERLNFYDDSTQITTILPYNLDTRDSYGLEINGTIRPVNWFSFNTNIDLYRSMSQGENDGNELSSDGFSWAVRANSRFRLPEKSDIQAILFYRAPQNTTQGKRKAMYALNLAVSKDILSGKGTLVLNVHDVFNSRKWRHTLDEPGRHVENVWQGRKRSYTLTFSYRLNQKKQNGRGSGAGGNDFGSEEQGF
jgi:outer membrane receptor protein involved in Fe transport